MTSTSRDSLWRHVVRTLWLAAVLATPHSGCDKVVDVPAYDQRIRGVITVPGGGTPEFQVEAETFDPDLPKVSVLARSSGGHFELFVPPGEYRVWISRLSTEAYYGSGGAQSLSGEATPVVVKREVETPVLEFAFGTASVEIELPRAIGEYDLSGELLHPVLGRSIARAEISSYGDTQHALFRFAHVAPGDYEFKISMWDLDTYVHDQGIVPILIDGAESPTLHVSAGNATDGTFRVGSGATIHGTYEGPIVSGVLQQLNIQVWEANVYLETGGEQGFVRTYTTSLFDGRDFEIPVFLERDLLLSWSISTSTTRFSASPLWYGPDDSPVHATRVRPGQGEDVVLRGSTIAMDFSPPEAPGGHDGKFRLYDETEDLVGEWASEEGDGETTIVFANLRAGTYFLKYEKRLNSNLHDQWYGPERTLQMEDATPIDVTDPGSLQRFAWTPYPGGSISGTVTLETGELADDYWVVYKAGDSETLQNGTRTNAQGEYALVGFEDDLYRVGIARGGTTQITWYPGTTDPNAAEYIPLVDYPQITGIDIQLIPLGGRQAPIP